MKSVAAGVTTEIRQSHVNTVAPVLTAEWNQNRYYKTVVDNTPTEDSSGYDIEMYPIESITMNDRPSKRGIAKAVVGMSTVAADRYDQIPDARFYAASVEDIYKYWQSPEPSGSVAPFTIANCAPQVLYMQEDGTTPRTIKANKISFTIENSYVTPDAFTVQIKTTTGGAWTTVATNPAVPTTGKVELWYNGTSWTTTKNLDNVTDVHAVRLVVTSLDGYGYFNLIELGFRMELDLTVDLVSVSDQFNMGEVDFITPLGTVSANNGSVTLVNDAGKYDNDNASSVLYGLIDKNVQFNLVYRYASGDVQQFKLNSDSWSQSLSEVTVTLVDRSSFFMDINPQPLLYENIPVQEAIWRICDSIGFTDYEVTSVDTSAVIDIFWTTGEESAWEVFQQLSRGTQTAIYFDGDGILQIKTRESAFPSGASPVWTLRETQSGNELPDIIDLSESDQYEANKVSVNYQPTGFSEMVGNIIPFEVVWEPEGTVVLRASELVGPLMISDSFIKLSAANAKVWPWSGMCQIDGEWISYEGKRYGYYNASDILTYAYVKSLAEQQELDAITDPALRYKNAYTGELLVKERGLFNTEEVDHPVTLTGWTTRRIINYSGSGNSPATGLRHNRTDSTVTLESKRGQGMNSYFYVHRGNAVDQGWRRLGTKMRIDKSAHKDKAAGIFFNGDALGAGYFVEVMATSRMSGAMRKQRNEILFYSMKTDGTKKQFGGEKIVSKDRSKNHSKGATKRIDIGAEAAVVQGRYIELDVYINCDNPDHQIQVWVNGRLAFTAVVPNGSGWQHSWVSRFGMYVRGNSKATFEYIYGISRPEILYDDEEIFIDRIEGGYKGNQWENDYVYNERMVRKKIRKKWTKVKQRYSQRFFDEFGPIVHEIREFKVKFATDGLPVLESKLFNTNDTQTVVAEYTGDVAGANFIIANTSRQNAIVNGDDNLTAVGEGTINHKMFVYGRPVIQKDSATIERTDDWALRRRGVIEVEYASKWIQNEEAATALADWLTTNWTRSESTLDVEVFGNPLFELGDVVAVDYQDKDALTHLYYVVGVNNDFDAGLTTNLTLRRVSN